MEQIAAWRKSDVFTARERLALELAECMTYPRRRVSEAMFRRLQKHFTDEQLVELAAAIALENFRSKFNPVFGIEAAGACPLPWVQQAVGTATERLFDRRVEVSGKR